MGVVPWDVRVGGARRGRVRDERVESSGDVWGPIGPRGGGGLMMRKFWKTGRVAKNAKKGTEGRRSVR